MLGIVHQEYYTSQQKDDPLAKLLESITDLVAEIVITFGIPGIGLIAFAENIFPPTPSELLYPLAGKLAYDGEITLIGIVIAGVIGSLIGSLFYYGLGYQLGEVRARQVVGRLGIIRLWRYKIKLATVEEYDRALELFQKHGGKIVFIARLMPLVHSVVSIPAGVSRMRLLPFMVYTTIGSILWIAPLTLLGYWLGSNWEQVLNWLDVYQTVWYIVIVAAILYWIIKRYNHNRQVAGKDQKVENGSIES